MEIIVVLISRLLVKKEDVYNLIKNATIIDKKGTL